MFGDKQAQQVGSGSIAVQAGGNVNIGLQLSEVRELVQLFLNQNFPVLREEARAAAEVHVKNFLGVLEHKLLQAAPAIEPQRFRDPDVQATLNDAVQASARKGGQRTPMFFVHSSWRGSATTLTSTGTWSLARLFRLSGN